MNNILEQNIEIAKSGRIYFMEWLRQFHISETDAIWLFTGLDSEREVFLKYTKQFKQEKNFECIHVILPEHVNTELLNCLCEPYHFVPLQQITAVIKLYDTYVFSNRLFICDFDEPTGRKGRNMLFHGIKCNIDELAAIGILGLKGASHED